MNHSMRNSGQPRDICTATVVTVLIMLLMLWGAISCSSEGDRTPMPGGGDGDTDADGDTDGDSDSDGDADDDSDGGINIDYDPDKPWIKKSKYTPAPNSCGEVILAKFRDFTEDHPDFQRINLGWGPLQGVVHDELGSDKKPVFNGAWGDQQVVDSACQETCPNGGVLEDADEFVTTEGWSDNWLNSAQDHEQYDPPPPMYDGKSSFQDWYTNVDGENEVVEKWLILTEQADGSYVFDSNAFFPIEEDEGLGAESGQTDADGNPHNFLFTTEVHLQFTYKGGERFTFRGDDDLWIFVNNKLALDLGGMHWPFEGTIDFDRMANTLDIEEGETYDMDIYHAERHTEESNFRIETNIDCFIVVEVE